MQLQRFPLIILAFAIGGCSVPNDAELEQERTTSADAAIRSLPVDDWCKAEADRDIEAKMKLFTTDAVLMPPGNSDVIGQQAIRAWHEKMWQGTKYQCSGTIDEVQVSGDWGMVRGTFSGVFTPASGAPQPSSGRFLNTVQQQADGSWKIASGIWNSELPSPGAASAATSLEGAWVVTSWTDADGNTNDDPQPALYIFTSTHYSIMIAQGDEPRAGYEGDDMSDAEKLGAYDTLIANAGRYEIDGNVLKTRAYVAKDTNYMGGWPENEATYEFELDGDSLTVKSLTFAIGFTSTLRQVEGTPNPW